MLVPTFLLAVTASFAQTPGTPAPTPPPGQGQRPVSPIIADNAKYDRLRSIELMTPKERDTQHPLLDPKRGIYRIPTKEETVALAVNGSLAERYGTFLRNSNTGIVKLNANSECVSDTQVVGAKEECAAFTMPGGGIAFSFRTESYRMPRLADLILHDGIFKTGGVLQHVLMAEIGDVAIEDVNLQTKGMKFLIGLKPVRDSNEFIRFDEEILKGINADGFFYRRGHLVKANSTYLLRSIAYRGQYFQTVDGIQYDELAYDKRRDVIVAFRVVEKDEAGNITIVWNRLRDVEAPRLRVVR